MMDKSVRREHQRRKARFAPRMSGDKWTRLTAFARGTDRRVLRVALRPR